MIEELREIYEAGARLRGVNERRDSGLAGAIVQLDLNFDFCCIAISVSDEDELKFKIFHADTEFTKSSLIWESLLGQRLFGYWSMQNQLGYMDAVQLTFGDDTSSLDRDAIQIQAVSSGIAVYKVVDQSDIA